MGKIVLPTNSKKNKSREKRTSWKISYQGHRNSLPDMFVKKKMVTVPAIILFEHISNKASTGGWKKDT